MKKAKKLLATVLAAALALSLCAAPGAAATSSSSSTTTYSMDLSDYAGSWTKKTSSGVSYYQLTSVVYCTNPTNPELQCMNIYVPAAYMNSDGTVNEDGVVGEYTATTAPILYVNGVAGYNEASAGSVDTSAISAGYIYVSVGSRGRSTTDSSGNYTGKSPWGLVDLKAGIRFLKANDDVLAGSSDRIISQGTSAGGNMSALLGTTGNSSNYDSYLEEMGAIMDATDDVFASMCYCPISDLENADLAYEWMFYADTSYTGFISIPAGVLTDFQKSLSTLCYNAYIEYYNSLGLVDSEGNALTIGSDGRSGTGYEYFMSVVEDAATTYLTKLANGEISSKYTVTSYVAQYASFLSWDGTSASITSIDDLVLNYNGRMKACLSFDDLTYQQGENEELGTNENPLVHFNTSIAAMIASLQEEYPTEYATYYEAYASAVGDEDLALRAYLLNPLNYIDTDEECDTASYFRIRVGTLDPHTSFTVAMNLALKLDACEGIDVDYAMVWDEEHGEADYSGELFAWIDSICAQADAAAQEEDVDDTHTEHTYASVVTAPTCTEAGYTTYTCSVCGDSYIADQTEATGHSYEAGTCTICGEADPDYTEPEVPVEAVASVNGVEYGTLQAAIDAATAGETVTLLCDVTETIVVAETSNAIIDLGGYTVTGSDDSVFTVNGTVTIQNGTITGGYGTRGGGIRVYGTVTLEAGLLITGNTVYDSTSTCYGGGIYVYDGGTLIMNDGVVITGNSAVAGDGYKAFAGGVYAAKGATFYMNGGYIYGNSASTYGNDVGLGSTAIWTLSMDFGTCVDAEGHLYTGWYKDSSSAIWSESNITTGSEFTVTESGSSGYGSVVYLTAGHGEDPTYPEEEVEEFSIVSWPESATVAKGTVVDFTVVTTGEGVTYQWYFQTATGSKWYKSTGGDESVLSITATDARNGYKYYVVVTDAEGNSYTSEVVTLTVGVIVAQPESIEVVKGETATFSVVTIDGCTYQWQYKTATGTKWYSWDGATEATFDVTAIAGRNGYSYRCKITTADGTVYYSDEAVLTVVTA